MIVDTSALVCMLRNEPEAAAVRSALTDAPVVRVSASTLVEAYLVLGAARERDLDDLLAVVGAHIVSVDADHAKRARDAHRRFGRGSGHAAKLNFGDCFSYACASSYGEPLLYIGDDFARTDIESALTR